MSTEDLHALGPLDERTGWEKVRGHLEREHAAHANARVDLASRTARGADFD